MALVDASISAIRQSRNFKEDGIISDIIAYLRRQLGDDAWRWFDSVDDWTVEVKVLRFIPVKISIRDQVEGVLETIVGPRPN